jgi:hypothetical protein
MLYLTYFFLLLKQVCLCEQWLCQMVRSGQLTGVLIVVVYLFGG